MQPYVPELGINKKNQKKNHTPRMFLYMTGVTEGKHDLCVRTGVRTFNNLVLCLCFI